jgi:hypothetical protein
MRLVDQIDLVSALTATQPVPDSLLINGVGHFNCSMAVPARPVDCVEHYIDLSYLDFDDGLPYRIRVVNTGQVEKASLFGQMLTYHQVLDRLYPQFRRQRFRSYSTR